MDKLSVRDVFHDVSASFLFSGIDEPGFFCYNKNCIRAPSILSACFRFFKVFLRERMLRKYMQWYRSGHNGADSKSVCGKPHEGSNPSHCATSPHAIECLRRLFLITARFVAMRAAQLKAHLTARFSHRFAIAPLPPTKSCFASFCGGLAPRRGA